MEKENKDKPMINSTQNSIRETEPPYVLHGKAFLPENSTSLEESETQKRALTNALRTTSSQKKEEELVQLTRNQRVGLFLFYFGELMVMIATPPLVIATLIATALHAFSLAINLFEAELSILLGGFLMKRAGREIAKKAFEEGAESN